MDTFRLPRSKIFDSRSDSFLPDLMVQTKDRGVDLVLNSLSGELLHASWKCVAPFGKMLEIGKRDFIGHARLAMDIFEANRSFIAIDLAQLVAERPQVCQKLLRQCLMYYRQGEIEPIRPTRVFSASQAIDAFRYMQTGQHLGKIVISIPESTEDLQVESAARKTSFLPDATYLLVGGLGGLGRAVATWMVERGAKSLLFLSRSAGSKHIDKAFFRELEAQGCHATAFAGSITSIDDLRTAISLSPMPITGVLQFSMILKVCGGLVTKWSTKLRCRRIRTSFK